MNGICKYFVIYIFFSIFKIIITENILMSEIIDIYDKFKNEVFLLGKYRYSSLPYFNDDKNQNSHYLENLKDSDENIVKLMINNVKNLNANSKEKINLFFYNGIYYDEWWNIQIELKENKNQRVEDVVNFFVTYGKYLHKSEIKSCK